MRRLKGRIIDAAALDGGLVVTAPLWIVLSPAPQLHPPSTNGTGTAFIFRVRYRDVSLIVPAIIAVAILRDGRRGDCLGRRWPK